MAIGEKGIGYYKTKEDRERVSFSGRGKRQDWTPGNEVNVGFTARSSTAAFYG